jgi:hypothetical protein
MFLALLMQLSAAIAAFCAVAYAIGDQLFAASRMADSRAPSKRVKGAHVAPALMRSANRLVMKVGLMLAAVLVVLSIGMTFYYRTIMSWLFF